MIFYLLLTGLVGFAFTSLLYYSFTKNAIANPEEIDSYMKAAASGKISQKEFENFTVHLNKKAAS